MTIDRPLAQPRPNHVAATTATLGITPTNWPVRLTIPGRPPRTLRRITPIYADGHLLAYRYAGHRGETTLTVYLDERE